MNHFTFISRVSFTAPIRLTHVKNPRNSLADLPEDWSTTTLEIVRRLGRKLYLEADVCEIYDYYEDDPARTGFPGTNRLFTPTGIDW